MKLVTKNRKGTQCQETAAQCDQASPTSTKPSSVLYVAGLQQDKNSPCDSHSTHRCMWWLPSLFQLHCVDALINNALMFSTRTATSRRPHRSKNKPSFPKSGCRVKIVYSRIDVAGWRSRRDAATIRAYMRGKKKKKRKCRYRQLFPWGSGMLTRMTLPEYADYTIGDEDLCGTPITLGLRSGGGSQHTCLRVTPPL